MVRQHESVRRGGVRDRRWVAVRRVARSVVVGGLLLAAAPWLFRFADLGFRSYLVLGALEVTIALFTRTAPRPALPGAKSAPIGGNLDKPRR